MRVTYIEWLYPGILTSETSAEEVPSRVRPHKVPDRCFGYRFYDREEQRADGEMLVGKSKNHSPWTYFGRRMTVEQVENERPKESVLISNMRNNNIKEVVFTKFGQAIPIGENDSVEDAS